MQTLLARTALLPGGWARDVAVSIGEDGRTDAAHLAELLRDDTACVVVGYPNFLGCVEDLATLRARTKEKGALLVTATAEPFALSLLKAPGSYGDGSGAAPVPPSEATTTGWRPWHLGGRPARRRGTRLPDDPGAAG